jgi:hypothetical protein
MYAHNLNQRGVKHWNKNYILVSKQYISKMSYTIFDIIDKHSNYLRLYNITLYLDVKGIIGIHFVYWIEILTV